MCFWIIRCQLNWTLIIYHLYLHMRYVKKDKYPFYIKVLKINILLYLVLFWSITEIIFNSIIVSHRDNTKYIYRFYKVMSRNDWFIQLYCWIGILMFFVLLIIIIEIIFIKNTNNNYPLPKNLKIKYFIFNWSFSSLLLYNYLRYKKWTKQEYINE